MISASDAYGNADALAGGTFSQDEFERNANRFWACPVRLLTDGTLAQLLGSGRGRGRGIATSLLPVLCLLTWPGKKGVLPTAHADRTWTPEVVVSLRYLSRLAGIDRGSARRGIDRLTELGLARVRTVRGVGGHSRIAIQLSATLYADAEEFTKFPAELIYGGAWSLISSPAARHLLLVIQCNELIHDKDAFLARLYDGGPRHSKLSAERRRPTLSVRNLGRLADLAPSTVEIGLSTLTRPLPGSASSEALVVVGVDWDGSRWYELNVKAVQSQLFVTSDDSATKRDSCTGKSDGAYRHCNSGVPISQTLVELVQW